MQTDIFNSGGSNTERHYALENGALVYVPHFYNAQTADKYFATLREQAQWKQETLKIYGKSVLYPRLTAWYGDNGKDYEYSGTKYDPNPWLPELETVRNDIGRIEPTHFNSVLLNLYRNGNDSVSWHTDSEPELGTNPVIASVNLGAARRFLLRRIDDHTKKMELLLEHGSLLIMKGELQHYWQHQVPKAAHVVKERINLTYRYII